MTRLTSPALASAVLVALAGLLSLGAQGVVSYGLTGGVSTTIWVMAGYFTVLTNLLVTVTFSWAAVRGRAAPASWHAGLTLWIVIVGVVYHLVLAPL